MKAELPEFDVLLEMAEKRPEQLEALRSELVEAVISSAREDCQRRLRGLQFQIDSTRRTAGSPMAACLRISQMMHESLNNLRECLNEPVSSTSLRDEVQVDTTDDGRVVSMLGYRMRKAKKRRQGESALV